MSDSARDLCEKITKKSLGVPCEILHVFDLEDDFGEIVQSIEIVRGNSKTGNCIGVHRHDPYQYSLCDALDVAARDGFERIYLYGDLSKIDFEDLL